MQALMNQNVLDIDLPKFPTSPTWTLQSKHFWPLLSKFSKMEPFIPIVGDWSNGRHYMQSEKQQRKYY